MGRGSVGWVRPHLSCRVATGGAGPTLRFQRASSWSLWRCFRASRRAWRRRLRDRPLSPRRSTQSEKQKIPGNPQALFQETLCADQSTYTKKAVARFCCQQGRSYRHRATASYIGTREAAATGAKKSGSPFFKNRQCDQLAELRRPETDVLDAFREKLTVDRIPIPDQEPWHLSQGKRFDDLLSRPNGHRIRCDGERDDVPPVVTHHEQRFTPLREGRFELPRVAPQDPKSCASANSATRAENS